VATKWLFIADKIAPGDKKLRFQITFDIKKAMAI